MLLAFWPLEHLCPIFPSLQSEKWIWVLGGHLSVVSIFQIVVESVVSKVRMKGVPLVQMIAFFPPWMWIVVEVVVVEPLHLQI